MGIAREWPLSAAGRCSSAAAPRAVTASPFRMSDGAEGLKHRATLRRRERLRGAAGVGAVLRSGRRWDCPRLRVIWRANGAGYDRLGVVVSRAAGNAVLRNRMRRVLRDVFRTNKAAAAPFNDIVLIARGPADVGRGELEQEYRRWRDACVQA